MRNLFGRESIEQKGEIIAFNNCADGLFGLFSEIRIYERSYTYALYTQRFQVPEIRQ